MFPLADIPVRVVIDAIDNASKELQGFGKNLEGVAGQMRTVGAVGLAVGGATLFLAKGFVEQAGAMEQNRVAFETMLGSAEKAKTLLQEMTDFAARTPFNLPDIVNAGKQLLAYGFQQKEVISTTEMLGNVASGLNIPIGDIIYLFGTLRAQGRAYTKDLNQFTARGIPILDQLAKQYGITTSEVFKFAETGKIGFADIEKAFQTMTGEGGMFFNLMDKQSKTTMGTWSNFQDSITRVQITLGDALLPAVMDVMNALMPLIERFGEWAKANPELVKNLVIAGLAIGAIGGALLLIGTIIMPVIAFFSLLGSAVAGFGIAIAAVGAVAAFIVSPIGLIIIAVLAIIGVIMLVKTAWQNNWFDIQGKVQAAGVFIQTAITGIIGFLTGLWNFVLNLPTVFTAFVESLKLGIYVFFTETLPFAIGFLAGRLVRLVTEDLPNFVAAFIQWFINLRVTIPALVDQMKNAIITFFTNLVNSAVQLATQLYNDLVQWFKNTARDTIGAIEALPGEVARVFNSAKDKAVSIITDTYNTLKGWGDKIVGILRDIVDWAGNAINKAREAVSAGFNAGKRQYGGPVSSASPVIVGEAGPELIVPQVASTVIPNHALKTGGGSGSVVQFIINTGVIINSPTERRNLAEALYKDLATLARSQNMTVAELMGA